MTVQEMKPVDSAVGNKLKNAQSLQADIRVFHRQRIAEEVQKWTRSEKN
jgi:hypothetical protein